MAGRPLIGLPGRRITGGQIVGYPEVLADVPIDAYLTDYAKEVVAAGGLPVHLPLDADPADLVDRLDGVVLTGGADIDPSYYGATRQTDLFPPEPARDAFEMALVDRAHERSLPVLGICRGLQLLNVRAGGSLHQDVPTHVRFDVPVHYETHAVSFRSGTVLHGLYGDATKVNSLHHQTVDRVGDGLVVTATAEDGTVEGLEATDGDIIAVQWHPEMLETGAADPAFTWIVERARAGA